VDGCDDVGGSKLFVELTDESTLGRIIRPPRMLRMCSAHLPAYIYCGVGASATLRELLSITLRTISNELDRFSWIRLSHSFHWGNHGILVSSPYIGESYAIKIYLLPDRTPT